MTKNHLIYIILTSLFTTGCSAMDCDELVANKIVELDGAIFFRIYTRDGTYWGDFTLNSIDHSVAHSNNSMEKFRVKIQDLDYVRYVSDVGGSGHLVMKWTDEEDELCISTLQESYWTKMMKLVESWPQADKFSRKN